MITEGQMNYGAHCDRYWAAPKSAHDTAPEIAELAEQVMRTCGPGRLLDIGAGEGRLVAMLLRRGMDAYGLDAAATPVKRANVSIPGRFTLGCALSLPYPDGAFDTVVSINCLQQLAPEDVPRALREIARVCRRSVFLRIPTSPGDWHLTVRDRAWWERLCFEAGLRKHPAYYELNAYETLNDDGEAALVLLERVPGGALERFPLEWLQQERDLHMDMLREAGSRSDAHVGRYQMAARYIRPGDVVIDAACGMGYGVHVTHATTRCARVTGIDGSAAAVAYARANFGLEGGTTFVEGYLPLCLRDVSDASVDVVISFETLEHVEDPEALLAEFYRILTPGGRIVASVPHDWSDETGHDPNPFHLHVYDKARFVRELRQKFDLERLIAQTANRVKKPGTANEWLIRPRSFADVDPDADGPLEAEWLLAVACKSPLGGELVPYAERTFTAEEQESAGHALAFARDYDNPWLVRSLVSIGMRTENTALREQWARGTLSRCREGSADEGAALCVLGYLLMESGRDDADLERRLCTFTRREHPHSPNALRWQVSIAHVLGLMSLARGRRDHARGWFEQVLAFPVSTYSATLLTKPAEAALHLGILSLADGDPERACQIWSEAYGQIVLSLGARLSHFPVGSPPAFELREIASVALLLARLLGAARLGGLAEVRSAVLQNELQSSELLRLGWMERQLAAWQKVSAEREAATIHLRTYVDQLHTANEWLEGQRKAWEAVAAQRESYVEELRKGNAWLDEQRRAWESVAGQREEAQAALVAENVALRARLDEAKALRGNGLVSRAVKFILKRLRKSP